MLNGSTATFEVLYSPQDLYEPWTFSPNSGSEALNDAEHEVQDQIEDIADQSGYGYYEYQYSHTGGWYTVNNGYEAYANNITAVIIYYCWEEEEDWEEEGY